MYSIQIALFERKIYYVVKFHFSFFFRILIKEFLLKNQIFKALLLKIYIYGNVCNQRCLPFIAVIFDHI